MGPQYLQVEGQLCQLRFEGEGGSKGRTSCCEEDVEPGLISSPAQGEGSTWSCRGRAYASITYSRALSA